MKLPDWLIKEILDMANKSWDNTLGFSPRIRKQSFISDFNNFLRSRSFQDVKQFNEVQDEN